MVELGNERVEEDKIDHLVDKLFRETGSDNKSAISFTEFQQVLKGHDLKEYLNVMSLDMQCQSNTYSVAPTSVFTARCYAYSAAYRRCAVFVRPSVCPSCCLSRSCVVSK